eukprot:gene3326-22429_t
MLPPIAAAVFAAASFPTLRDPPRWSSATLGGMVFAHAGKPTRYTEGDLALLA